MTRSGGISFGAIRGHRRPVTVALQYSFSDYAHLYQGGRPEAPAPSPRKGSEGGARRRPLQPFVYAESSPALAMIGHRAAASDSAHCVIRLTTAGSLNHTADPL